MVFKTKLNQLGMSLVEMIISMFLVLILFVFLVMEVSTLAVSKGQRYENVAYHVANKQMENLRSTSFASLPASGTIFDSLLDEIPSGNGSFTVIDHPGYAGLKELVITVSWNHGISKSVVLRTLAGSGGFNSP